MTILNFFILKFHNHKKAQNAYKRTKIKNAPKKHLRGKCHLFAYLRFVLLLGCVFVPFSAFGAFGAFSAFGACEIFS